MAQYKLKKYKFYKPGEEIKLEKVTTAERIADNVAKGLIVLGAVLFIVNLIRFIF